jgi:hypothetical protein
MDMPARTDRTLIVPLLLPHFPELEGMSSGQVAIFLDTKTGLTTPDGLPNSSAFDRWRKALAAQGYQGVWKHA